MLIAIAHLGPDAASNRANILVCTPPLALMLVCTCTWIKSKPAATSVAGSVAKRDVRLQLSHHGHATLSGFAGSAIFHQRASLFVRPDVEVRLKNVAEDPAGTMGGVTPHGRPGLRNS